MPTRRENLKQIAIGAALPFVGASSLSASTQDQTRTLAPGSRTYSYLGRTPGYRDWAVIPPGLTIQSIETFLREPYALVRITASDGTQGW